MNGKDRVLAAIRHEIPDRVPVGEWGIDHDHVERIIGRPTYWRNRKATTLALWDNRRDEVVEGLKRDCVDLVKALDYDVVTVELVPSKKHHVAEPPRVIGDGVWEDAKGAVYRYAASNDSIMSFPQRQPKEALTPDDIARAMKRVEDMDDSVFELIDFAAERFGSERAVLCRSLNIYSVIMDAFGGDYTHDLILTLDAPEEIQKMYEVCLAYNRKIIDHCAGKNVLIQMQGHDFGSSVGCIMSPDTVRDLYMPVMRQVNADIAARGMIPFFHCCGKIWDILDDFVDVGYQGYQSIQESAGMDTKTVKERYGDRLTLWTGVQCETLVDGTPAAAEAEVRRNLSICMPGGGFIFGSTNSVQFGAKTDNYLKALDVVRREGVYR